MSNQQANIIWILSKSNWSLISGKEEKQRLDLPDEVKVGALLDLPIKVEIGVQDDFEMTCGKDAVSRLDLPDEVEVGALLDLPKRLRSESREKGPREPPL